jgi:PhoD-like phosphatase
MPELVLGPLLRYVDGESATIWVETDRPCAVEVVAGPGSGSARTWQVAGHHYALVPVTGLRPGTTTAYRVTLDGTPVWPLPGSQYPPSTIRTLPAAGAALRVAFGSCSWAGPAARAPRGSGVGPDALDTLATRLAATETADATDPAATAGTTTADPASTAHPATTTRPDVLILLGDQVYADETSTATREYLAARRGLDTPPGDQVANYEEYTHLYYESWLDPAVRWLLSTVPSLMVFDDHDVIDDWNTSASWREDIRATSWWSERIIGGLASYWVYQHLGNLSPDELEADKVYAAVRAAADGAEELRRFAVLADTEPSAVRWSYRRDFGRVRLLMVDSRAARVLEEERRAMLDPAEWAWLEEQATEGSYDHLLIGTSLPWLLPQAIHDVESWNAALCAGRRGARWARIGERLRRAGDLEHWAAFRASFDALAGLIARVGGRETAPATVCVLSGDVHHGYLAEARFPETRTPETRSPDGRSPEARLREAASPQTHLPEAPSPAPSPGRQPPEAHPPATPVRSRVLQLTCSPLHNAVPAAMRAGFRLGWGRFARRIGRALVRHGRVAPPPVTWEKLGGPYFGNQVMTLTLDGRAARLRLERAVPGGPQPRLETTFDIPLTSPEA